MKNFLFSIVIFSLFSIKSFGHVEHYADFNYLEYELFRNDKSIGIISTTLKETEKIFQL